MKRKCHCGLCGLRWESEKKMEDVVNEFEDLFPDIDINNPDEAVQLCEPCFIKVMDHACRTDFYKYIDKSQLN